jgi:hypothetical protein
MSGGGVKTRCGWGRVEEEMGRMRWVGEGRRRRWGG